jgi:hypothetical protein
VKTPKSNAGKSARIFVIAVIPIVMTLAIGCQSFSKQNRVSRQDEAGSTHVAILSTIPWQTYAEALQPTFKITAEDALIQAIPDTTGIEEKLVNAFAGKLKIALPQTSTSSTEAITKGTGKEPTSSVESTNKTQPGDVSSITFAPSPLGSATASGLSSSANILTNKLGIDPVLRYLVANALYQEVQLLNQQVKNAAIDESSYTPYLIRLQVSVLPRQRDEPYDAYANISFFLRESKDQVPPFDYIVSKVSTKTESSEDSAVTERESNPNPLAAPMAILSTSSSPTTPKIIPLLVTDNIDAALHSRATESLVQLAFALSGMVSGVGIGSDLQSASDKLRTTLGRDFNSTFTVARVSENTLRVRFGAIQQGAGTYAMLPQTHDISVLLLMPKGNRSLALISKTTMIDADKGTTLAPRDRKGFWREVKSLIRRYGVVGSVHDAEIEKLLTNVEINDFKGFQQLIRTSKWNVDKPESLWLDLALMRNGSQYASTTTLLPESAEPSVRLPAQTPTLLDDAKTVTSVSVQGGEGLRANQLRAALILSGAKNGKPLEELRLLANKIDVVEGGRIITASFPSLGASKLAVDTKLQPRDSVKVEIIRSNGKQPEVVLLSETALYQSKPSTEPTFSMEISSRVINSANGVGKVTIGFPKLKSKVHFTIDGADLGTPLPSSLKTDTGGLYTDTIGSITLDLQNLNPIANVVFTGKDDLGATVQIVRPVLEVSKRKQ